MEEARSVGGRGRRTILWGLRIKRIGRPEHHIHPTRKIRIESYGSNLPFHKVGAEGIYDHDIDRWLLGFITHGVWSREERRDSEWATARQPSAAVRRSRQE